MHRGHVIHGSRSSRLEEHGVTDSTSETVHQLLSKRPRIRREEERGALTQFRTHEFPAQVLLRKVVFHPPKAIEQTPCAS